MEATLVGPRAPTCMSMFTCSPQHTDHAPKPFVPEGRTTFVTMPPFRALDSEEQAVALQKRADETRLRKNIADITATLRMHPHAADIIRRELARHHVQVVDASKKRKSIDEAEGDSWDAVGRATVPAPSPLLRVAYMLWSGV